MWIRRCVCNCLTCFVRARYFQFVHYIIIDQWRGEKCNFMQLKDDYWNLITKVAFRQQIKWKWVRCAVGDYPRNFIVIAQEISNYLNMNSDTLFSLSHSFSSSTVNDKSFIRREDVSWLIVMFAIFILWSSQWHSATVKCEFFFFSHCANI